MKQKDIALIAVVAIVSGAISLFVSGKIFVTSENRQQKAEIVDVINTEFNQPDKRYFNDKSVNPAQSIQLGNGNNTNPFNGSTN